MKNKAPILLILRCFQSCSLPLLASLFIMTSAYASHIVVKHDEKNGAYLNTTSQGIDQVDIVKSQDSVSLSKFEEYNIGQDGIVINNGRRSAFDKLIGMVGGNSSHSGSFAKTIVLEVAGDSKSELEGVTTIVGESVKLVLVNPKGIVCNGCSFVNAHSVEFRTSKLESVNKGSFEWGKSTKPGDITIGSKGLVVRDGSLLLDFANLKVESAANDGEENAQQVIVEADRALDLNGDKVNLPQNVKLKCGKEFLKLTVNEINGGADIESKGIVSVLSQGNISFSSIKSCGDISIGADGDVLVSAIDLGKKGNLKLSSNKITISSISGAEDILMQGKEVAIMPCTA